MTNNYKNYIFNFSASFMGGGLKRILAYLHWFNEHDGSIFILNNLLKGIEKKFPNNHYYFLRQTPVEKIFGSSQLSSFLNQCENIDFYYSYNIPLPGKIGKVNWIHLANVLPFVDARKYVSFKRSLEMQLLGFLIKRSLNNADIISAESEFSLSLLKKSYNAKRIVSINGNNEEINAFKQLSFSNASQSQNIAVAVGTCRYKCIDDVYKIYLYLRKTNPTLGLIIAGIKEDVPNDIKNDPLVILKGTVPQPEVCELLMSAKYYITATLIENSYNSASEGAFLAQESLVSDIGPHRELFKSVKYKTINTLNTRVPVLCVKREDLNPQHLKSWEDVISEMITTCVNKLYFMTGSKNESIL